MVQEDTTTGNGAETEIIKHIVKAFQKCVTNHK